VPWLAGQQIDYGRVRLPALQIAFRDAAVGPALSSTHAVQNEPGVKACYPFGVAFHAWNTVLARIHHFLTAAARPQTTYDRYRAAFLALPNLNVTINDLQVQLAALQVRLDVALNQRDAFEADLEEVTEERDELEQSKEELEQEKQDLEDEKADLEEQLHKKVEARARAKEDSDTEPVSDGKKGK